MVPNGTAYANYPSFANTGTKTPPGGSTESAKYSLGMVPADTFPAEWANWLFHGATAGITRLNADTGSIKKEINSVLSDFNITPDATLNNQLLTAMRLNASFITASSATITGPLLVSGGTIRVMFTAAIAGTNTTTGLTISYNGQNIPVKVCKDGALQNFCASQIAANDIKYLQAYTTLELIYDSVQFIIIGNPIVLSGTDYKIYANGYKYKVVNVVEENNMNIVTSNAVAKHLFPDYSQNLFTTSATTFTLTQDCYVLYLRHTPVNLLINGTIVSAIDYDSSNGYVVSFSGYVKKGSVLSIENGGVMNNNMLRVYATR